MAILIYNPLFLIFDIRALRQSARMSKIKNGGLDQYGADAFDQQQFGTAGVERVKPDTNYVTLTRSQYAVRVTAAVRLLRLDSILSTRCRQIAALYR